MFRLIISTFFRAGTNPSYLNSNLMLKWNSPRTGDMLVSLVFALHIYILRLLCLRPKVDVRFRLMA